jgi:2-polyprenyl-3-methyl-5-hydroxy-6-metoxy-1,4-benzoquinol methylase
MNERLGCNEKGLAESRLQYYLKDKHLYEYQMRFINSLLETIDLKGKRVLEIGGSQFPNELVFQDLGAEKWVCLDKPWITHFEQWSEHYAQNKLYAFSEISLLEGLAKHDYLIFNERVEGSGEDFSGVFDVCISLCAFEHIENLLSTMHIIHRSLKPCGEFFTQFGPIWSSVGGSHFWVNEELNFNKRGPIPDHAHLLLSYPQILDIFLGMFDLPEAEAHAYNLFSGTRCGVNRYFYEDYERIMEMSKFSDYKVTASVTTPTDQESMKLLEKRYAPYKRFDVWEAMIYAKKQEDGFTSSEQAENHDTIKWQKLKEALFQHYYGFSSEAEFIADEIRLTKEEKDYISNTDLPQQLFLRTDSAKKRIVPWLESQIGLSGCSVLEIGAGTGCSLVALAEKCERITGVDIQQNDLEVARIRSEMYKLHNVDFIHSNAVDTLDNLAQNYDIIIFYACLEHMTIDERIEAMSKAWKQLKVGKHLVIVESPNRAFWYDYHTAFLPFFHLLPTELAARYSKFSSRVSLKNDLEGASDPETIKNRLARWGTGFGYQEIEIALETSVYDLNVLDDLVSFELQTNGVASEEDQLNRRFYQELFRMRNIPMPHSGFF